MPLATPVAAADGMMVATLAAAAAVAGTEVPAVGAGTEVPAVLRRFKSSKSFKKKDIVITHQLQPPSR